MNQRQCKDCPPGSKRKAIKPGPRCATHYRAFRAQQKTNSHDKYVQTNYGLAPGEYSSLYELQGGCCFICQRATGKVRKLATDHDHKCCPELPACGKCVRGLLCKTCNRILGQLRDDPAAFQRAAGYLIDWPMKRLRSSAPAELGGATDGSELPSD